MPWFASHSLFPPHFHISRSSVLTVDSTNLDKAPSTITTAYETTQTTKSDIKSSGTCEITDNNEDISAFYNGEVLERKTRVSE